MQFIPDYIKRKYNPKIITLSDPALELTERHMASVDKTISIMAHDLAG
jgi:hypothetical protein